VRGLIWLVFLGTPLAVTPVQGARGAAVGAAGRHLADALDRMNVEQHWLPGTPVNWRTGEYDPEAAPLKGHCSAFVAAVCAAFNVYILRPPEHREWLLANAQCRWLESEGSSEGWTPVPDGATAQRLANQGNIVIACYQNPDRDDAGHVAAVRPSAKTLGRIEAEGPDIAQAGGHNYNRTTVRNGFRLHSKAWRDSRILYYSHETP